MYAPNAPPLDSWTADSYTYVYYTYSHFYIHILSTQCETGTGLDWDHFNRNRITSLIKLTGLSAKLNFKMYPNCVEKGQKVHDIRHSLSKKNPTSQLKQELRP